jgi:hypothetical protein
MDRRERLEKAVEEAERELDAARTLTALNAAAKKLQLARSELKALEAEEKPKRPSRGRGGRGALVCRDPYWRVLAFLAYRRGARAQRTDPLSRHLYDPEEIAGKTHSARSPERHRGGREAIPSLSSIEWSPPSRKGWRWR